MAAIASVVEGHRPGHEQGEGLLRDTELAVEEVTARVGYGSPFAFSHAFRRAFGEPPLRYRRTDDL